MIHTEVNLFFNSIETIEGLNNLVNLNTPDSNDNNNRVIKKLD